MSCSASRLVAVNRDPLRRRFLNLALARTWVDFDEVMRTCVLPVFVILFATEANNRLSVLILQVTATVGTGGCTTVLEDRVATISEYLSRVIDSGYECSETGRLSAVSIRRDVLGEAELDEFLEHSVHRRCRDVVPVRECCRRQQIVASVQVDPHLSAVGFDKRESVRKIAHAVVVLWVDHLRRHPRRV